MTTEPGVPTGRLLDLLKDASFQNEVAQVRAKSLLSEILEGTSPIHWTYDIGRVTRNATGVVVDIESGVESAPGAFATSLELQQASLTVAQLWESLARLEERTTRQGALVNAAILYQVAGYQANAACLASRLLADREKPLGSDQRLVALFVRRLFLACIREASSFLQPPDLSQLGELDLLRRASTAMLATGLGNAARFFLNGDAGDFEDAGRRMAYAERGLSQLGLLEEANAVRGLRSLLPIMLARSTWSVLGGMDNPSLKWPRYLKLLARGTGAYVFQSPSVSELWPSQLAALEAGLLTDTNGMIIRVPTSAGKTRIAEIGIVHTLTTQANARCLYIAPYRALVTELQDSFLNVLADLGFRVSSFVGAYDADPFEQLLAEEADVLIMTPERLDLLLRLQPEFFESVRLVVLDEGQIVNDLNRGPKYELLLSRLKARIPEARFLFLSAVIPNETIQDFAVWLKATPEGIVNSRWRPSVLRIAKFQWKGDKGVIEYESSEDLEFRGEFVHGIIEQRTFEHVNPTTRHVRRPRFPTPNHKAQTAAELAIRFAELGPVLIFCPQTNLADFVAQAISYRLDLMELIGETVPSYFATSDTRSVRVADDSLGENHSVSRLLRRGIALHHGRLPDGVRNAVETDYRERRYRIVVATNTLAQGVNLPVRTVIIHSCYRRDEENNEHRITARDYWNIAGRAGRAGWETEGTVIHLVITPRDRQDYRYFLEKRESLEPVDSVLLQIMDALVRGRIKSEDVTGFLDADLLPLLVEEDLGAVTAMIDSVVEQSLAAAQAARRDIPMAPLKELLHTEAGRITNQIPDHNRRKTFSDTGLGVASSLALQEYMGQDAERLRELLLHADEENFSELTETVLRACVQLDEMRPIVDVPIAYGDALSLWIRGTSTVTLHRELTEDDGGGGAAVSPSIEDFARFVNDFFSYKLPWGTASFLRIASAALEIEQKDMSPYAKYLPAMIKFGVPHPEAAWAMSVGIPLRRVAMELATNFRKQTNQSDLATFREWLSTIDEDDLKDVYRLEGDALQDVSAGLSRTAPSLLVRDLQPLEASLPLTVRVAGVAYGSRRDVASGATVGRSVVLRRDYDNTIDRNAIEVMLGGQQLGFIPRATAQYLAPEMDAGVSLSGEVAEVTTADIPRIDIRIGLAA